MAMSSATTLADRLAAAAQGEAPDLGAADDVCCLPSCGRKLHDTANGMEGGVKLQRVCPVHDTRGTQHLRARGTDISVVPGHLHPDQRT
jgi:hypothetical protein